MTCGRACTLMASLSYNTKSASESNVVEITTTMNWWWWQLFCRNTIYSQKMWQFRYIATWRPSDVAPVILSCFLAKFVLHICNCYFRASKLWHRRWIPRPRFPILNIIQCAQAAKIAIQTHEHGTDTLAIGGNFVTFSLCMRRNSYFPSSGQKCDIAIQQPRFCDQTAFANAFLTV